MRLLINSINYFPELTGIGKYTGDMCEWLAEQGFDVRVVTAPPYYPEWKIGHCHSAIAYRRERLGGVTVFRCPLWVPPRPTGLTRLLHLVSFALTSLPVMIWQAVTWRPNVVLVVEPAIACAPAAWLAARASGGVAWLHVQDFEVDAAFQLGILQSKMMRRLVGGMEGWLLRRFDRVSTISERMVDKLAQKGIKPDQRMLFPNWVDTDQIRPIRTKNALRQELGISDRVSVLLYSGNMGEKQGLELLIEAAQSLRDRRDILFVLCGDGVARRGLELMARGLRNVQFIPLQPVARLNELLNLADVHLLPQRADAQELVMPSKLTGMLASGRPVVTTAAKGTQVGGVVGRCGIVLQPGDLVGMRLALVELVGDASRRKELGDAGRRYSVEHWGREDVLRRAFSVLPKVPRPH